jgi:site-specific DNA-methyltransferase (adenine-specific)
LLTDPPYCLLTRRRKGGELREPKGRKIEEGPVGRFESVRDYRRFTEEWLSIAVSFLSPRAPVVLWTNFLGKEPLIETARGLGFRHMLGEYRWCKQTAPGDRNEILLRVYEVALVLMREPLPAPGPADPAVPWSVVGGYDDDGLAARWGNHPNHKPFSIVEPLVRSYSRPGALILDTFAGSGSIPEAALRLGRRVVTMEIEREWANRVKARLGAAERGHSSGPAAEGTFAP